MNVKKLAVCVKYKNKLICQCFITEAVLSNSKFFRESENILKTLTNATLSCLEAVINKTMDSSKTILLKKENPLLIRHIAFCT